jgi:hypothetical protein
MTTETKIPNPEEKKNFAKAQLQFLREKGITEPLRLSRIFKAAGPGQIQEAWKLANQAQDQARKDLLDCLLVGAGGAQDFGKDRMEAVLKLVGFEPPNTSSSRAFFRVIDGASEVLIPGAFDFDPAELKEIEDGLAKSRERAKKTGDADEGLV